MYYWGWINSSKAEKGSYETTQSAKDPSQYAAEAAQQYQALIGRGYRDAAVYYNLGNSTPRYSRSTAARRCGWSAPATAGGTSPCLAANCGAGRPSTQSRPWGGTAVGSQSPIAHWDRGTELKIS